MSAPFALQSAMSDRADVARNGAPIGSILAWHKSLPDTPELPDGWVECNGQVIDDSESPYHELTVPNLNGARRFLRGSSSSGTMEAMDWKSFSIHSEEVADVSYIHSELWVPKNGSYSGKSFSGYWSAYAACVLHFRFDDSEVRPVNMSVVWIMRVR